MASLRDRLERLWASPGDIAALTAPDAAAAVKASKRFGIVVPVHEMKARMPTAEWNAYDALMNSSASVDLVSRAARTSHDEPEAVVDETVSEVSDATRASEDPEGTVVSADAVSEVSDATRDSGSHTQAASAPVSLSSAGPQRSMYMQELTSRQPVAIAEPRPVAVEMFRRPVQRPPRALAPRPVRQDRGSSIQAVYRGQSGPRDTEPRHGVAKSLFGPPS